MPSALEGPRHGALAFVNFKDDILARNNIGGYDKPCPESISERFYRELIQLYDRCFPGDPVHERGKFDYMRDKITDFQGGPTREGNAVCIGIYRKGRARYRYESTSEMREREGNRWNFTKHRWFSDRIAFFTYSMRWQMTFQLPNRKFNHTFEETIYTRKENWRLLESSIDDEEYELYLDARIHAYVMERMMNPRHKDHQKFRDYPNRWLGNPIHYKEHASATVRYESTHPIKSNIALGIGQGLTFVWEYKGSEGQVRMITGIRCRIDDIPSMKRVGEEEKDLFLRVAEELDSIPQDEHFLEIVKQKIAEAWGGHSSYEEQFLTAYLDWAAAAFHERHARFQGLKKEQDDFLNPPTICCCIPTEGPSQFEEVARNLRGNDNIQAPLGVNSTHAKKMAELYQKMKDSWAQLYEQQQKISLMNSLVQKEYGYCSAPLFGIVNEQVPPLDMDASLSDCEAALRRWDREAERVLGNGEKMENFCARANSLEAPPIIRV
ncbi:MAG: hypothetical protein WB791_08760 [Waddliaceae bacterium]